MRMFNIGDRVKVTFTNQVDKQHLLDEVLEITDFGSEPHQFFCDDHLFSDFELSRVKEEDKLDSIIEASNEVVEETDKINNYLYTKNKEIVINKKFLLIMTTIATLNFMVIAGLIVWLI